MKEFWNTMISAWWGILILCAVCVIVWITLSALLYRPFFKRFYDILLSGIAIVVLSPLLLILIIVGAAKMKGNPFFTQPRPGKKEKIFKLVKFRTMTCEKDDEGNLLPDEKRLTKYGKFLRSTSLDELPELFNIFVGQMSIVGPRPLLVQYLPLYSKEQRHRHNVRPGLTGLAQVNGRNAISWEDKFKYDIQYVNHISLWVDITIFFKTIGKVFMRSGINQYGQETMEDFVGTKPNTPYYVISKEKLENNIRSFGEALQKEWPNSILSYSVKTNSLPWLLKYLCKSEVYAEAVSDEEYQLAQMCGFPQNKIIFNGPIKSEKQFEIASCGNSVINLDSVNELSFVEKYFREGNRVGIRINVNPEYFSEEDISFKEDGFRFGFSDEGGGLQAAIDILKKLYNSNRFGLHFHCNSSTRGLNVYRSICKYAVYIINKYELTPSFIDIGGGFFGGVEGKPTPYDYIRAIKEELECCVDIGKTRLIVEPGSAIIGSAVDLRTSVVDVKDTVCSRIVTTDGSRLHIDPLWKKSNYLYDLQTTGDNRMEKQIVCGYTCMDYDRIITLKNEIELKKGDIITYKRVGSYTMTFGGMFIRYLPDVYVDSGDGLEKVRARIEVKDYYGMHS